MAASTNLLADIQTVITNGPNSASLAKAILATGPIMDYQGNTRAVQLKLQESYVLLGLVDGITDSGDSANKALITAVLHALTGASAPSSTLLTAIQSVITTGPGATTIANAIAPAGPIMDYLGNLRLVLLKLQEALVLLGIIDDVTDASDSTNLTLITNLETALS